MLRGFSIQIAQVEYEFQTRYTRILDSKLLINRYNLIGHRLKLKYFLLAHFSLNVYQVVHLYNKI